jgi:putative FmdB family regulatory protein
MPIYEYRCDRGHTFEVMQRMSEDPLESCATCDAPVQRVFHPVAVHFKGSGFYTTDYGRNRSAASADSGEKEGSKAETAGSKSESSSSSGSESGTSSGTSTD